MKLRYKILYMSFGLGLVGVHPRQQLPDDEIQKLVISNLEDRHEDSIKISRIPNTEYSYTIF